MSCLGVHFALNADDMAELRQTDLHDEEALQNYLANLEARYLGEEGGEHSVESAKAWDAMHRLLTDGRLEYQNGEYPLNHAVIGGEILIGGGEDDTYIISLKTPAQVQDIAQALMTIDEETLRRRYFALDEKAYGYPLSEDDCDYVWDWFQNVRDFYQRAAAANRHVIFTVDQ